MSVWDLFCTMIIGFGGRWRGLAPNIKPLSLGKRWSTVVIVRGNYFFGMPTVKIITVKLSNSKPHIFSIAILCVKQWWHPNFFFFGGYGSAVSLPNSVSAQALPDTTSQFSFVTWDIYMYMYIHICIYIYILW